MEGSEWLSTKEVEEKTGYCNQALSMMVRNGDIPLDKTYKLGRKRFYHVSLLEILIEKRKEYQDFITGAEPKDTFEYDGYILNEEQVRRLECVRQNNGYSACHPLIGMSVEDKIYLAKTRKNMVH